MRIDISHIKKIPNQKEKSDNMISFTGITESWFSN